jgi:hypothetical protein
MFSSLVGINQWWFAWGSTKVEINSNIGLLYKLVDEYQGALCSQARMKEHTHD